MFGMFGKETAKAAEAPYQGQPVTINGERMPLEHRLKRAETRVFNLTRKLIKLRERGLPTADTEHAIKEWEKKYKLYEFELKLSKED